MPIPLPATSEEIKRILYEREKLTVTDWAIKTGNPRALTSRVINEVAGRSFERLSWGRKKNKIIKDLRLLLELKEDL